MTVEGEHKEGEGENEGGEGEGERKPGRNDPQFTQRDLDRLAANEKRQGKDAARRELFEKFGVSSEAELEDALKKVRDAEDENRTEAEKARKQADKDREDAARLKNEALQDRLDAKVERALLKAGVADKQLERVAKMLGLTVEATDDDIASALEDLKEDIPQLFNTEGSGDGSGGEENNGSGPKHSDFAPPRKPASNVSAADRAKELLHSRHPGTVKS